MTQNYHVKDLQQIHKYDNILITKPRAKIFFSDQSKCRHVQSTFSPNKRHLDISFQPVIQLTQIIDILLQTLKER